MRLSTLGKVGAAIAVVAVLAAVGGVTLIIHGRPQALGLAQTAPKSPAPSPSPDDPLALACRRPAVPGNSTPGIDGLWTTQTGSVVGYRAHEKFAELTSPHEAVARTERLNGWILVATSAGSIQLLTGCIAVDVRTLHSIDELPGFNTADRDRVPVLYDYLILATGAGQSYFGHDEFAQYAPGLKNLRYRWHWTRTPPPSSTYGLQAISRSATSPSSRRFRLTFV